MELLQIEFTSGEDKFHFDVKVKNLMRGGEGSLSKVALPFVNFDQNPPKNWRFTLLKVLESDRFNPAQFDAAEQQWLLEQKLLEADHSSFPSSPRLLSRIGSELFRAIFPGGSDPEKILTIAFNKARTERTHLHIRLAFSGTIPQDVRIPDYPWELLYDGQNFLSQDVVTFSRYIEQTGSRPDLPPNQTINVLLVSSGAYDTRNGLNKLPKREREAVITGLRSAQAKQENDSKPAVRIRLLELKNSTRAELRKFLADNRGDASPHVLHFDGHGFFGRRCDRCRRAYAASVLHCETCEENLSEIQGYLLFEDEDREADYVSANEFGDLCRQGSLADQPGQAQGVTVAVLSACKSGMSLGSESVFNGVAQTLVASGVPAVLAMQYTVRVDAAAAFTEHFYDALCHKNSLSRAVSLGRSAMGADGNQWYRPVLYLRWQDNEGGQIFTPTNLPNVLPPANDFFKWIRQVVTWLGRAWYCCIPIASFGGVSIVLGLRLYGYLQPYELATFDKLLSIRINDQPDPRLLIVEVTEDDLKIWDKEPRKERASLPDQAITKLLQKLDYYEPKAIGLDIYRPFAANPKSELERHLKTDKKIISICKVSDQRDQDADAYKAPPELEIERQGFSDFVYLEDGDIVRRYLFAMKPNDMSPCQAEFSFSLQLAIKYLDIKPELTDAGYKIGGIFFAPMNYPSGGYWDFDDRGHQILLDYQAPEGSIRKIAFTKTLNQVLNEKEKDINNNLKGRIVMVAVTAPEFRDYWSVPLGSEQVPGIILHAQMVSQVLRTVKDKKPLIHYWNPAWELVWILGWTVVGSGFGFVCKSRSFSLFLLSVAIISAALLVSVILAFVILRLWLPLVPSLFALIFASSSVFPLGFYADKILAKSDTERSI